MDRVRRGLLVEADAKLVNNHKNVLFRCAECDRGWHELYGIMQAASAPALNWMKSLPSEIPVNVWGAYAIVVKKVEYRGLRAHMQDYRDEHSVIVVIAKWLVDAQNLYGLLGTALHRLKSVGLVRGIRAWFLRNILPTNDKFMSVLVFKMRIMLRRLRTRRLFYIYPGFAVQPAAMKPLYRVDFRTAEGIKEFELSRLNIVRLLVPDWMRCNSRPPNLQACRGFSSERFNASNLLDGEVPEDHGIEFSDDEKKREYKQQKKAEKQAKRRGGLPHNQRQASPSAMLTATSVTLNYNEDEEEPE
ncbi:hypothetical protein QBC43DRAFT_339333 [Cladorrhinum sp. PSN259]|nr:hypothetical protein QBC43DRAFT_339333 [Cladorrhinum sp. PSN259]